MSSHFCISIHFLDRAYHGRTDGDRPEWPPSPLRSFQALVAAAARSHVGTVPPNDAESLRWLEALPPPIIVAPSSQVGSAVQISVPNNDLDAPARYWVKGVDPPELKRPNKLRTMKTIRPTWLLDGDAVHYLWLLESPNSGGVERYAAHLGKLAERIVALGWGIDLSVGQGRVASPESAVELHGERWTPGAAGTGVDLRVPVPGTLGALVQRHEDFVNRLDGHGYAPPPPLSAFQIVGYRREIDAPRRPFTAFSLLRLDASGYRSFDPARRALTVAGMLRHAAGTAAKQAQWPAEEIASRILGHAGDAPGAVLHGNERLAFVPLPSLEWRGNGGAPVVGDIRRVLVFSSHEACDARIHWAQRFLSGQMLMPEPARGEAPGEPVALLSLIPSTDRTVAQYTQPSSTWATVTPMVLPGYDDPAHYRRRLHGEVTAEEQKKLLVRLGGRIDLLIRKAIRQAGYSDALADHADLDWRHIGFWPGTEPAARYGVPGHLRRFPRYHVRLCFRDRAGGALDLPGPICLGGGRFCGLGLFARVPESR